MDGVETLAWPADRLDSEFLEDVGLRRRVMDLYDAEHIGLRRYLTCLGVDPETGRELIQESFLKLHLHLARSGDETNLRAWLYRVAHNLARNVQTARSARRTEFLPDVMEGAEPPSGDLSAEQRMLEAERQLHLQQSLRQLSARERECLLLRAQGLKYREIASVLHCSVSSVNENVQRAVERVRQSFGKEA